MNKLPSYSVVIPTIGRDSLTRAIESALNQTHPPLEIVVVGDGISFVNLCLPTHEKINYVKIPRRGVSGARNAGVRSSKGDWIAFLDDDDVWALNKMEIQLCTIDLKDRVVVSCQADVRTTRDVRIRPSKQHLINTETDIFQILYAKRAFLSSKTYIAMASIVAPREICERYPFDITLTAREDLWWYHQISLAGISIRQVEGSLIVVNGDNLRSRLREQEFMIRTWAERLNSVQQVFAIRFLEGIAIREAILSMRIRRVVSIIRLIWKLRHPRRALT